MTKTDKIRLFNDRNLKFLIKLYQNVHNLITIVLNSKNYGVCFLAPVFGRIRMKLSENWSFFC